MCKLRKRSGENKYQVKKDGFNHQLDRIIKKLETKQDNGKRQVPHK